MDLVVGQTLGHYEVVRGLGKGGMGEVYVARDTKLNRAVALKVLPAEMAVDRERRLRFEREAKTVAALSHPHIVTLFSVEEAEGVHFLTMELVDGEILAGLIPERGLTLPRLLELALALTDAVAAAHQSGITHRDLKPDNIMVDSAGRLKVLDFGLAKLREKPGTEAASDSQSPTAGPVTQEGKILGTAPYLSPEQAEGKPVDERSDVFSLGIILYEMATGRRPFHGDTPISTISSILRDQPRPITDLRRDLPRQLGRIVKLALAKDPQRRYQSAIEMRNELEELKDEIDSGELEVSGGAVADTLRGRVGVWLGLAAVILAGIALALSIVRSRGATPVSSAVGAAPDAGLTIRRLTVGGRVGAVSISPDGKYLAYAIGDDENRGSLRLRHLATLSDVEILSPDRMWPYGTQFSPEGSYIYFNRRVFRAMHSDVYRVPVLGGEPRKILEKVDSEVNLSPDGGRIVYIRRARGEHRLLIANADGSGETLFDTRRPLDGFTSPATWSADGEQILVTVAVWRQADLYSQHVAIPVDGGRPRPIGPAWRSKGRPTPLPDGSGLVFVGGDWWSRGDQLWFYPFPDGPARPLTVDLADYDNPSVTADGSTLVSGRTQAWNSIWTAPTADLGAMRPRVTESEAQPGTGGLTWSPDGDLIFAQIEGNDRIGLWMVPAEGGPARSITEGDHSEMVPASTSDGRLVFVTDFGGETSLAVRDPAGGQPRQLVKAIVTEPQVTPDDRWVLYSLKSEGVITLWKVPLEGGEPIQVVDTPIRGFSLSPSGTRLAVRFIDPETDLHETRILSVDGELISELEGVPRRPSWGADDDTLMLITPHEGIHNLWAWPVDGSEPYPLTAFDDPGVRICGWRWSRDYARLAVVRCRSDRNAVMISGFR